LTADEVTALASVGSLLVISATAIAAFVQLRHLGTKNQLMVLNDFREAFERAEMAAARDALPRVLERLGDAEARREFGASAANPEWLREALPLMRLMETLGTYVVQGMVSRELVCDMWGPVVLSYWNESAPLIAVMRRRVGPALFENWEAIAYLSKRWLDEHRISYPKNLPHMILVDPWAEVDGAAAVAGSTREQE
jgi:hypothetical protein